MSKKQNIFVRSLHELKSTRCIAVTALLIAINITLDLLGLTIKLPPNLRIGFGFLCNAAIGMLFGPVVGMMAGVCTDVLYRHGILKIIPGGGSKRAASLWLRMDADWFIAILPGTVALNDQSTVQVLTALGCQAYSLVLQQRINPPKSGLGGLQAGGVADAASGDL